MQTCKKNIEKCEDLLVSTFLPIFYLAEDVFESRSVYFPVHFTPPCGLVGSVTKQLLVEGPRQRLAHPWLAQWIFGLLLNDLESAKVDSLQTLLELFNRCGEREGGRREICVREVEGVMDMWLVAEPRRVEGRISSAQHSTRTVEKSTNPASLMARLWQWTGCEYEMVERVLAGLAELLNYENCQQVGFTLDKQDMRQDMGIIGSVADSFAAWVQGEWSEVEEGVAKIWRLKFRMTKYRKNEIRMKAAKSKNRSYEGTCTDTVFSGVIYLISHSVGGQMQEIDSPRLLELNTFFIFQSWTGKRSLQCCGDVEINPGPRSVEF